MACYHCHSTNLEYKFPVQRYALYQCADCELGFLHPQPTAEELSQLPQNATLGDHPTPAEGSDIEALIAPYLADFLTYTATSNLRILEIGRNFPQFTTALQAQGAEITRLELEELPYFECHEPFAACILFDGLEKTRDPHALLLQIRELLQDHGTLLLATPCLDSWSAKFLKTKWSAFKPESYFYFNTQNLESLCIKSGFTEMQTSVLYQLWNSENFQRQIGKIRLSVLKAMNRFFENYPSVLNASHWKVPSGIFTLCRKTRLPAKIPKLSIIMPVYNEKRSFVETVEQVLQKQAQGMAKELIIVESNSTDGTKEAVAQYENREGVLVLYEERPQGKGHAVRTGLAHVTGDIILIQDADSEYDVNDYDALLAPILKYQKMFVLGSRHLGNWKLRRFEDSKPMSFLLNSAHILFTWMINVTCGAQLKDPFTMYKVFRKECLFGLALEANRFDFDWELVIKFLRKNYFPLEIPVNYVSRSFSEGKKVRLFRDPISWMKALLKFRFGLFSKE